jgi:hypothetical protein
LAYRWLIEQSYVDPARSGLLGTCVGGSFALMASAHPLINDHVAFVSAYAPFSSMNTFVRDIASSSQSNGEKRTPWQVDPLTHKVFVHSVTAILEPGEAERLRCAFATEDENLDEQGLSPDGQAVYSLLSAKDIDSAETALEHLPALMQGHLTVMSPINYLKDIHAPLFVLLHDRGDQVIPVGESRRLFAALAGQPGVQYTEMQFQHLDPVKGKLPWYRLVHELGKLFRAMYPLFRQAVAS